MENGKMKGATCRIGTSGWVYSDWRGIFYPTHLPQTRWYAAYAEHFDTVEINTSFYHLPAEETFDHWREQAPPGFIYAVKANRYLTHVKRLKNALDALEHFLSHTRRLAQKLGPILWQLPPKWGPDPVRLAEFAKLLPDDMVHAFEFRDSRWFTPPVQEILEHYGLTFCIFDMPGVACPSWITSRTVYLRFHGREQAYGGRYGPERLRPWAERIRGWLAEGRTVYAYFNNDTMGNAIEDAKTLQGLLDIHTNNTE